MTAPLADQPLFQFTTICYSPDFERGERLNIGVIAWDVLGANVLVAIDPAALARAWSCRVEPTSDRSLSLDPVVEAAAYTQFLYERIHRWATPPTSENMRLWLESPNLGTYSPLHLLLWNGGGYYGGTYDDLREKLRDIMRRRVLLPISKETP